VIRPPLQKQTANPFQSRPDPASLRGHADRGGHRPRRAEKSIVCSADRRFTSSLRPSSSHSAAQRPHLAGFVGPKQVVDRIDALSYPMILHPRRQHRRRRGQLRTASPAGLHRTEIWASSTFNGLRLGRSSRRVMAVANDRGCLRFATEHTRKSSPRISATTRQPG